MYMHLIGVKIKQLSWKLCPRGMTNCMCSKDAFKQLVEILTEVNSSLQLDEGVDFDDSTIFIHFVLFIMRMQYY